MKRRSFIGAIAALLCGAQAKPKESTRVAFYRDLFASPHEANLGGHAYYWRNEEWFSTDRRGLPQGPGVQVVCDGVDCGRKVFGCVTGGKGAVSSYRMENGRYVLDDAGTDIEKDVRYGRVSLYVDGQLWSGPDQGRFSTGETGFRLKEHKCQ